MRIFTFVHFSISHCTERQLLLKYSFPIAMPQLSLGIFKLPYLNPRPFQFEGGSYPCITLTPCAWRTKFELVKTPTIRSWEAQLMMLFLLFIDMLQIILSCFFSMLISPTVQAPIPKTMTAITTPKRANPILLGIKVRFLLHFIYALIIMLSVVCCQWLCLICADLMPL
jgi:hypothetical protein